MRTRAAKKASQNTTDHSSARFARPAMLGCATEILAAPYQMIQRTPACACGGGCPRCQTGTLIQPKLRIDQPGDKYEQEADRVADQMMRMPEPVVQRMPT